MLNANVSVSDGSIGDGRIFVGDNIARVDNNIACVNDNIARVDRIGDNSDSFGRFGRQPSDSDGRIRGGSRYIIAVVVAIGSRVRVPPIRLA